MGLRASRGEAMPCRARRQWRMLRPPCASCLTDTRIFRPCHALYRHILLPSRPLAVRREDLAAGPLVLDLLENAQDLLGQVGLSLGTAGAAGGRAWTDTTPTGNMHTGSPSPCHRRASPLFQATVVPHMAYGKRDAAACCVRSKGIASGRQLDKPLGGVCLRGTTFLLHGRPTPRCVPVQLGHVG